MFRRIFYVLIVGVFALAMTVVPALAEGSDFVMNSGDIMTGTMVNSSSNSGGNLADGSYGGNGGDGGDIRNRGDVDESATGRGGNGGDSGAGGMVITGAALAVTDATNEIGNSRTVIDRCACTSEGDDSGNSMVFNRTRTMQMSFAGADANTGNNEALGSEAGNGGDGGTIGEDENGQVMLLGFNGGGGGYDYDKNNDSDVDESTTGIGGNGGSSGIGGAVQSGDSTSRTTFVNVVGRNITRISR